MGPDSALIERQAARVHALPATPRVWALAGMRAGDNAQVLGLAEALGWGFEVKRFAYRRLEMLASLTLDATLLGIDRTRSSPLAPPWPDLVIHATRRNEPVAKWIRERSRGRTRLVLVGRPWAPYGDFDLIVTTPQYRLPARDNILHNTCPLHRVTTDRLAAAAARWQDEVAHLPRPRIAVLAGGTSGPYIFDAAAAARLGIEASRLARRLGGALLITTSARTSRRAADILWAAIDVPAHRFSWSPADDENPYYGYLGLADEIVVTADSVSMVTEACATGKPVHLFEFGSGAAAMRPEMADLAQPHHIKAKAYALAMRLPPGRLNRTRDLRLVHRALIESGRASWLGEAPPPDPRPLDDLDRAVARVRVLMGAD